ncbi:N-chimaerin-like isoform X2 [Oratosquilla oratoria]|uniref:N-chimaerin-like isoform X2 n=1 Tax=Oratosquilla oratoria TaxID=337810 RepID=UPI003F7706C7
MNESDNAEKSSTVWKNYLYQLQQEAPKPAAVLCQDRPPDRPPQYGPEYHGQQPRQMCEGMLQQDGEYLVRLSQSTPGGFSLSLRYNGKIKHYRLYYDGKHYVGEKRFDTIHDLVADGLVMLHMEMHAGDYMKTIAAASYINSPHYTLTKTMRRRLKNLAEASGINKENSQPTLMSESTLLHMQHPSHSSETLRTDDSSDAPIDRPHRFNTNTFHGLHWCDLCGHFLWGFVSQGVKCRDCGFKCHKQCSSKVPNECCPDLKNLHSVFGVDLTTSLRNQPMLVPRIVTECIEEVEARGLLVEGIYRVPGSQDQIEALRIAFERDGAQTQLCEKSVGDVNVVAGVLKLYLRLLPIPLITLSCYSQLLDILKLLDTSAKISGIREALHSLPETHVATLGAVIKHLSRVCEHSAVNKMTATSLSTVFAPTLIQPSTSTEKLQPSDLLALASASQPRCMT